MSLEVLERTGVTAELGTQSRLAYGLDEIANQTGLSTAFLRKEAKAGNLRTKKFGARRLVLNEDLQNYLNGENNEQK